MEPDSACFEEIELLPYSNVEFICSPQATTYEHDVKKAFYESKTNCEYLNSQLSSPGGSLKGKIEVNSISTQTDSIDDSSDISSPCSSDISSLSSTDISTPSSTVNRNRFILPQSSSRKVSLCLLLLLVLITPCGQSVGAQDTLNVYSVSCGTTTCTVRTTNMTKRFEEKIVNSSSNNARAIQFTSVKTALLLHPPFGVPRNHDLTVIRLTPPTPTINTALIPHPLFGGHSSVKDLVPLPSTEKALILHPRFSDPSSITALVPLNTKDTALMVHPYVSLSATKELTILPFNPILSCKPASMFQSGHILAVIMIDRYIKNKDYRQCLISEHGPQNYQSDYCDSEASECPVRNAYRKEKIVQAKYTVAQANGGVFAIVPKDIVTLLLLLIVIVCRLAVIYRHKRGCAARPTSKENVPTENGHGIANDNTTCRSLSLHEALSHTSLPKISPAPCVASRSDLKSSPTPSIDNLENSPLEENPSSGTMPSLLKDSQTGDFDSGFGSMNSKASLLLSQTSKANEDEPSPKAANLHSPHDSFHSHEMKEFPTGSYPSPNPIFDQPICLDHEEFPDEDDEFDVREEIAHEAGLPCLSSDQPMTLDLQSLAREECNVKGLTTESEDDDCGRFTEGILEEGPQEPSLLSLAMPTTVASNDHPIMHDSSISINSEHFGLSIGPYPMIYNNLQQQDGSLTFLKDRNGEKIQPISLQSSCYQYLSSSFPSPKPPDININICQYEDRNSYSETMFYCYPSSVQEAGNSVPVNQLHADTNVNAVQQQVLTTQCPKLETYSNQESEEALIDETVHSLSLSVTSNYEFGPNEAFAGGGCATKSEDADYGRFNASMLEVGPCHPSLLSLEMPTMYTALFDDHPADFIRGEQDSSDSDSGDVHQQSIENESSTVVPNVPAPIIYNDRPYPHQENEIRITLEASNVLHGASVTVEPICLQSFQAQLPPPKPPYTNANVHPFFIQNGIPLHSPLTASTGYPPSIQEAGNPLLSNSLLIGGANITLPKLTVQSRLIAPNLHPKEYINSVVI